MCVWGGGKGGGEESNNGFRVGSGSGITLKAREKDEDVEYGEGALESWVWRMRRGSRIMT